MAIDIGQIVKNRFRPAAQAAGSRYFLLRVDKLTVNPKDPDSFAVFGKRFDTDEMMCVYSKKSSSGQKLPVVGEMMRADKATPSQVQGHPELSAARADYFYSYGSEHGEKSFCLEATVQPSIPRKNEDNGMWSAQVMAVDANAATDITADGFVNGALDIEIAKLLRPWEAQEVSAVTHDVLGRSIWGEGTEAMPGLTPFVTVRFEGESVRVYGTGGIKSEKSTDKNADFRLPTKQETLDHIKGNKLLNTLKSAFEGLDVEALKAYGVAIIPGVALQVGRDSLSGSNQKYLKVPEQFQWKDDKNLDALGAPIMRPGYRGANIHIKASRTGRMIVVDTVPAAGGTFSRGVPLTPAELVRKNGVAPQPAQQKPAQQQTEQQAPQETRQAAPAKTKQQVAPEQKQEQVAPAQQAAPVQQDGPPADQFPPADSYNQDMSDYADYGNDLADIAHVADDFFSSAEQAAPAPEMADDYLEAQMKAARTRSSGPRM